MDAMVTVLATVVVLGVLIFVHELGHFLAAKAVDIEVQRFSLGLGPKMAGFQWGETEYVISWFPLGGYVKMLDEREGPVAPEELSQAFNRQSLGNRTAVVAAGPIANFARWASTILSKFPPMITMAKIPVSIESTSNHKAATKKSTLNDCVRLSEPEPTRSRRLMYAVMFVMSQNTHHCQ